MLFLDTIVLFIAWHMLNVLSVNPPQLSIQPDPAIQDEILTLICQVDPTCVKQLTWYYWNFSNPVSIGCAPQTLANTLNLSLTCDTNCPFPTECNLTMIAKRELYNGIWYCDCDVTNSTIIDINVPILGINATQSNVVVSSGNSDNITCITECGYPKGLVWWHPPIENPKDQTVQCSNQPDVNETHSQIEIFYNRTSSFDQFICCTSNGYGNYCDVINVTFPANLEVSSRMYTPAVSMGAVDLAYGAGCLALICMALCPVCCCCIKPCLCCMIVHGKAIQCVAVVVHIVITLATAALLVIFLTQETSTNNSRRNTLMIIDSIAFMLFLVDMSLYIWIKINAEKNCEENETPRTKGTEDSAKTADKEVTQENRVHTEIKPTVSGVDSRGHNQEDGRDKHVDYKPKQK